MTNNIQNCFIYKNRLGSFFIHRFPDNPIARLDKASLQLIGYLTAWLLPSSISVTSIQQDALVTQHQANTWDCIGYTANPGGGKIYQFKLKEEYRILHHMTPEEVQEIKALRVKKTEDLFPAIEDFGDSVHLLLNPQVKVF